MATEEELPKVTLYWLNQSRSQRILWLLEELKVPYDIQVFHRNSQGLAPPAVQKIHPLGKSPVIKVTPPPTSTGGGGGGGEPVVLAESGYMVQYLVEHLPEGKRLVPERWREEGLEGKVGGETEGWRRYQYLMHYCEGSLMPILVMCIVIGRLKLPPVPFFVRPITSMVADRIFAQFIFPNAHRNFAMLDDMLATAPDGGPYLCGSHLTAADILMSFPLIAARGRLNAIGPWKDGDWAKEFPRLAAYADLLEREDGYQRAVRKVEEVDGKFEASL